MELKIHDFETEYGASIAEALSVLTESGEYSPEEIDAELSLELEGFEEGETRYNENFIKVINRGELGVHNTTKNFMTDWLQNCIEFTERNKAAQSEIKNQHHTLNWYKLIGQYDPEIFFRPILPAILTEAMTEVEEIKLASLVNRIGMMAEITAKYLPMSTIARKEWKKRYEEHWKEQTNPKTRECYVAFAYEKMVEDGLFYPWKDWTINELTQVGDFLLRVAVNTSECLDIKRKEGTDDPYVLKIKDTYVQKIRDSGFTSSSLTPILYPMVIKPKPWTTFDNGGYWINSAKQTQFAPSFLRRNIVEQLKKEDLSRVFASVNKIQDTAFCINQPILELAKKLQEDDSLGVILQNHNIKHWAIKQLPSERVRDEFIFERMEDGTATTSSRRAYRNARKKAFKADKPFISRRMLIDSVIDTANKMSNFNRFYFPHRSDFRGRIYPLTNVGLDPQKGDLSKALLYAANKKPLGKRGMYWLKVACATLGEFGYSKNAHPDVRATWVDENLELIRKVAQKPLETILTWSKADAPLQFVASCMELVEALDSGLGEQFMSGFFVSFDGSCSGIQHYSAMLRDEESGRKVNLIPMDTKQDLYKEVAIALKAVLLNDIKERVGDDEQERVDKIHNEVVPKKWQLASYFLDENQQMSVSRSLVKQNVMTYAYSVTERGMFDQLQKFFRECYGVPTETYVDDLDKWQFQACLYLSKHNYNSIGQSVQRPTMCMHWLQAIVRKLSENGKGLKVYTPDGFPLIQEYLKQRNRGRGTHIECPNLVLNEASGLLEKQNSVQYVHLVDTDVIDAHGQEKAVAPNFIHSMDSTHLRMTVLDCADKGVDSFFMIHDSFGTVVGDAQIMHDSVRHMIVVIYDNPEHDMIEKIDQYARDNLTVSQYESLPPKPTKGTLDIKSIVNSTFAFL